MMNADSSPSYDCLRRMTLIDEDRRRTTHVVVPGALAVLGSARD